MKVRCLPAPEAVAAAVAYVDARFSLLAASAALAEHDPSYQPPLERLRRGLEADRYGLVAHVLTTRGCNGADCPELRLLRDPTRVVANMKAHAFEAFLGAHALGVAAERVTRALAVASCRHRCSAPPPSPTQRRPLARALRLTSAARRAASSPEIRFSVRRLYSCGQHHERRSPARRRPPSRSPPPCRRSARRRPHSPPECARGGGASRAAAPPHPPAPPPPPQRRAASDPDRAGRPPPAEPDRARRPPR